jgi:hypothetical protein
MSCAVSRRKIRDYGSALEISRQGDVFVRYQPAALPQSEGTR